MRLTLEKLEKEYAKHGFKSKKFKRLMNEGDFCDYNFVWFLLTKNLDNQPEIKEFLENIDPLRAVSLLQTFKHAPNSYFNKRREVYLGFIKYLPQLHKNEIYNIILPISKIQENPSFSIEDYKLFDITQMFEQNIAHFLIQLAFDKDLKEYNLNNKYSPNKRVEFKEFEADLAEILAKIKPNYSLMHSVYYILYVNNKQDRFFKIIADMLKINFDKIKEYYEHTYADTKDLGFMKMLLKYYDFDLQYKLMFVNLILEKQNYKEAIYAFNTYAKELPDQAKLKILNFIKANYKKCTLKQIQQTLLDTVNSTLAINYICDFESYEEVIKNNPVYIGEEHGMEVS